VSKLTKIAIAIFVLAPLIVFGIKYLSPAKQPVNESKLAVNASESPEKLYSSKCASCHGVNGEGSETHPAINKLTVEQFVSKVVKHSNSQNTGANPVMNSQVSSLAQKDIEALAKYATSLKSAPSNAVIDANISAKKQDLKFEKGGAGD